MLRNTLLLCIGKLLTELMMCVCLNNNHNDDNNTAVGSSESTAVKFLVCSPLYLVEILFSLILNSIFDLSVISNEIIFLNE